jgi:hypothetical protein
MKKYKGVAPLEGMMKEGLARGGGRGGELLLLRSEDPMAQRQELVPISSQCHFFLSLMNFY